MHISKQIRLYIVFLLSFITILGLIIAWNINHDKILVTAIFEDLELYTRRLTVYYKGFKLGRATKIYLSDDGKTTNVEMRLKLKGAKLPDNVYAKIKTRKKKEFVEIMYPKYPSDKALHNDDVILGYNSFDINSYIDKQADSGSLDEIKENLNTTVKSAGETLNALADFINTGNEILKDIRPNLKTSSENLAKTTGHLEYASKKFSKSTDSKRFNDSMANLEQTTKNIEIATRNFDLTAQNLTELTNSAKSETLTLLDSTMGNINKSSANLNCITEQVKCILSHAEDIVRGLKITLSKKFSGMKIMFGKAID